MCQLAVRLLKGTDGRTEIVFQHFLTLHHLPHRYAEIFRIKRFRDIHLRTCRESRHLLFHLMSSGNYDDRYMCRLFHRLNPPGQFNATDSRHHDITDYHIRINFVHHLFHPLRVLQGYYIKVTGEDFTDKPQHFYFIINHQQGRTHLIKLIMRKFQNRLCVYLRNIFRSNPLCCRCSGSRLHDRQGQCEHHPSVRRIFHFQRAVQQLRHIVGDGKPQSITGEVLLILIFKVIQDRIAVEDMLEIFFLDDTSFIGYPEHQYTFLSRIHFNLNALPIGSIFECIRNQIDNDCIQEAFVRVPHHLFGNLAQESNISRFRHFDKGSGYSFYDGRYI